MQPRFIGQALPQALLATTIFTSTNSFAENTSLDPIVITATRTEQSLSNTLAPTTLITRQQIEQSQASDLNELLSQQIGIDLTRTGGFGSNSSLLTRGTETSHTLLLIDGVKVGSATTGAAAFQHIPLQLIERIEIIRGPKSSLYGSEAIGGVIQLITRKGSEQTRAHIFASEGTHNTHDISTGVSGSAGKAQYSLNAAYFETDGISSLSTSNPDKDGYTNKSLNASYSHPINQSMEVGANLIYAEGETEYDTSTAFSPLPFTNENSSTTVNTAVSVDMKLFLGDNWDSTFKLASSRDESEQFLNNASDGFINTEREQFTWQNDFQISKKSKLSVGFDYIDDKVESTFNYSEDERSNKGYFTQLQTSSADKDLVIALRQDDNEAFGNKTTGNFDLRFNLKNHNSLTFSYGKAFKAPTFNDLYWPAGAFASGNPDLDPENSTSIEMIARGKSTQSDWSLSLYRTQVKDLIEWAPNGMGVWMPTNLNKAQIRGLETTINTKLSDWNLQMQFGLLDPVNQETGEKLIRRSSKNANLNLSRQFAGYATAINIEAHGERTDAGNVDLAGYGLLSLRGSYKVNKDFEIKAKLDNALDKDYEQAFEYNSLGRTVYISAHYKIQ